MNLSSLALITSTIALIFAIFGATLSQFVEYRGVMMETKTQEDYIRDDIFAAQQVDSYGFDELPFANKYTKPISSMGFYLAGLGYFLIIGIFVFSGDMEKIGITIMTCTLAFLLSQHWFILAGLSIGGYIIYRNQRLAN